MALILLLSYAFFRSFWMPRRIPDYADVFAFGTLWLPLDLYFCYWSCIFFYYYLKLLLVKLNAFASLKLINFKHTL